MKTISTKRQLLDRNYSRQWKRTIKMGKQIAPARGFVNQCRAKLLPIHRDKQKIMLIGEMFARSFTNLRSRGKMDEAIGLIDRRTIEYAFRLRFIPHLPWHDLVDGHILILVAPHTCCRRVSIPFKRRELRPSSRVIKDEGIARAYAERAFIFLRRIVRR